MQVGISEHKVANPWSSRAVCSFTFVCCCLHGHRQLHDVVHPLRVAHLPGLAALRALLHQEPENIAGVFRTHRVPLKGILHQITSVAIIKMIRIPKGCWLFRGKHKDSDLAAQLTLDRVQSSGTYRENR